MNIINERKFMVLPANSIPIRNESGYQWFSINAIAVMRQIYYVVGFFLLLLLLLWLMKKRNRLR